MSDRPQRSEIAQNVKHYLHRKYNIATPPANGSVEEVFGRKHDDFQNADTVSLRLAAILTAEMPKGNIAPLNEDIQKFADVAFNIARVAKQRNAKEYDAVVSGYIESVVATNAVSTEPPNLVSNATFEAMTFEADDRKKLTGKDILREAVIGQAGQLAR